MAGSPTTSDPGAGVGVHESPGPRSFVWSLPGLRFDLTRPAVMGILNLTPDSFSDGGELRSVEAALDRAESMVEAGARMLDVGGESTRPGADLVPVDEEIRRVVPFVEAAASRFDVPVSVDTRKAAVAEAALDAGAVIVNDVSGLSFDPEMAPLVAERGVGLVLMHMRGTPDTMVELARYDDVVGEVVAELGEALHRARAAGVDDARIVVDPGLGFAKKATHNVELLGRLEALAVLGRPLLVGPSRKRFLGAILEVPPRERVMGTAAACVMAYVGGARVFRVHDVAPVVEALRVAHAVEARDFTAGETGPDGRRLLEDPAV